MNTENSILDKINHWIRSSVTLKLITITLLMLMLLIPTSMIESIIYERKFLSENTIREVSQKWGEQQQINGPILTIPLLYEIEYEVEKGEGEKKKKELVKKLITNYWHILPEQLNIEGEISPEKLKRGIYEVIVYKSKIAIAGTFDLDQYPDRTNLKKIQYDQAFLTLGISDMRGIKNEIQFNWDDSLLAVEPGSRISGPINSGITIPLPDLSNNKQLINFDFNLDLLGSQNMSFIPLGSTTRVHLTSDWPSPKFNGNFLPDFRDVSEKGFEANWKVLKLNRNIPQSWIGALQINDMSSSEFGVDLIPGLDDYQKSTRSAKYAVMTIALTFLIFFLVEILYKRKIHPFQYILVGLALCLFYVLLVSISEHSNFNKAYAISTFGVVSMISLYALSIFKVKRLVIVLLSTLIGIYGFLFVTLQLADYALLMGSLGLTIILAATMYFTRNINWYKLNIAKEE